MALLVSTLLIICLDIILVFCVMLTRNIVNKKNVQKTRMQVMPLKKIEPIKEVSCE